jgi:hypothetical protein
MTPIWIIERSEDAGRTWRPLQTSGFKLKQATAEKLVAKDNEEHARIAHCADWRERAVEYVAKAAE